ncbi:DUF1641 domain-containing protein [Ferroplasma acidiphilum]|uniref:DUF1641 domain-containing protein n=1 Tax=Ferroplasma acidiphilum TaxID=74969 RepID=UPI0023F31391|nr:DUF1641 domain-containing protein [Ferroplasma acidiphilum]
MSSIMDELSKNVASKEDIDALTNILNYLPAISKGLDLLNDLEKKGTINSLLGLTYLVASLKDVLTDDMINGLGSLVNSSLGLLSSAESAGLIDSLIKIMDGMSSGEIAEGTRVTGTLSLMRQLKDPEVQNALTLMINALKVLGKK